MAHSKHDEVRQRYEFRCGYCGVSETDYGGEMTVDHYHPVTAGGDDSDDNLVYACFRCNLYKSDTLPQLPGSQQKQILHPLLDELTVHLRMNSSTGLLESFTVSGQSHIEILHLNRPALVGNRLRLIEQAYRLELWIQERQELQGIIDAQEEYIGVLERLVQRYVTGE